MGPSSQSSAYVTVSKDVTIALPSPAALGMDVTASQLITARWQGSEKEQNQQLPVQLQVSEDQVILAGFSAWGTRLLSLTYRQTGIETQVLNGLEQTLPQPEQVLFNLMLSLWPKHAWEAALEDVSWSMIDDSHQRQVFDQNNDLVFLIQYENGRGFDGNIRFESVRNDYQIEIQTLNHQLTQR